MFAHEKLGLPECPYVERWTADFKLFSIRLHKWMGSDDQRAYHNHAWWYITLVLRGMYVDRTEAGDKLFVAGRFYYRPSAHTHSVLVLIKPTWTLMLTGPVVNPNWGFWINGKFKKRNRYFYDHKHHPCD